MTEETIKKARSTAFSSVYATNILMGETDSDVRIYAFNEILESATGRVAVSEGSIIMTEQATVLLFEQLSELMERWKAEGKQVIVSPQRRETFEKMKDKK